MSKCVAVARSQSSHCRRRDMEIWNRERQVKATVFPNFQFPFNKQTLIFLKTFDSACTLRKILCYIPNFFHKNKNKMYSKFLKGATNAKMKAERQVTERRQTVRVNERGVKLHLLCFKPYNCNRGHQKTKI